MSKQDNGGCLSIGCGTLFGLGVICALIEWIQDNQEKFVIVLISILVIVGFVYVKKFYKRKELLNKYFTKVEENKSKAEQLYNQAKSLYHNNTYPNYDLIITKLYDALDLADTPEIVAFLKEMKRKRYRSRSQFKDTEKVEHKQNSEEVKENKVKKSPQKVTEDKKLEEAEKLEVAINDTLDKGVIKDNTKEYKEGSAPQPTTSKSVETKPEDTRIKKHAERLEGYGMFNDEYDEYIPQNIAEAIARKMSGQELQHREDHNGEFLKYSNDKQDVIYDTKQKQIDKLIGLAKGFIEINSYKGAWEQILKIEKVADNDIERIKEVLNNIGEESASQALVYNLQEKLSAKDYEPALKQVNFLFETSPTAQILIKNVDENSLLLVLKPVIKKMLSQNDYQLLISELNFFINLRPTAFKIKKQLERVDVIYNNYNELMKSYEIVEEMYQRGNYSTALTKIKYLIEDAKEQQVSTHKFEALEEKILFEIQKKKDATNYKQMLTRYTKKTDFNFEAAISSLEVIISRCPKQEYMDFLEKLENDYNNKRAKDCYEKSLQYFENKSYHSALKSIEKALDYAPDNNTYIELKNTIEITIEEEKRNEEFAKFYKKALQAYKDASFDNAMNNLEAAMNLKPDDMECIKLMKKVESRKIDITICTPKALFTLDFADNILVDNVIQARNNGMMWYDYQKFAEQFGIMPHLWADVEEKIEFPLKQANKYGRRLDW